MDPSDSLSSPARTFLTESISNLSYEGSEVVMSERVQSIADSIYKEFERVIGLYDEGVVKELMPLVVGVLENLDNSFKEKDELAVEMELIKEDNEQLLNQYEREKQLRRSTEQRCLAVEDALEEQKNAHETSVESLESNNRLLELKMKNSVDHANRLEEKENELKKEYEKLHGRYTDLLKTHMDYMDRVKLQMGFERMSDSQTSSLQRQGVRPASLNVNRSRSGEDLTPNQVNTSEPRTPGGVGSHRLPDSGARPHLLQDELNRQFADVQVEARADVSSVAAGTTAAGDSTTDSGYADTSAPVGPDGDSADLQVDDRTLSTSLVNRKFDSHQFKEVEIDFDDRDFDVTGEWVEGMNKRIDSMMAETPELDDRNIARINKENMVCESPEDTSLFTELSEQDAGALEEMDHGPDLTGMSREVENLIMENNELIQTKNALNVVKDDLIVQVDELSSELEAVREELQSTQSARTKLREKLTEIEDELRKKRDEIDKLRENQPAEEENTDENIPSAQRKRFTRMEMSRVLKERNQYKERLMELQEAVRWTEMIRAQKENPSGAKQPDKNKKKGGMWGFFGNLFKSDKPPRREHGAAVTYNQPSSQVQPVGDPNRPNREKLQLPREKAKAYDFMQEDRLSEKVRKERERERKQQYKQLHAHVAKDDGRLQAYGWSLPAKFTPSESGVVSRASVPVPVYCRPLPDVEPSMKLWCAAGVDLCGGRTMDGGNVVGASVFYGLSPDTHSPSSPPASPEHSALDQEVDQLNDELREQYKRQKAAELYSEQLSSLVWLCSSTHASGLVSIVDANSPSNVLDVFRISTSHVLSVASVPGAIPDDYDVHNQMSKIVASEPEVPPVPTSTSPPSKSSSVPSAETVGLGNVSVVECATGADTPLPAAETNPTQQECSDDSLHKIVAMKGEPASAASTPATTPADKDTAFTTSTSGASDLVRDGQNPVHAESAEVREAVSRYGSVLPTMWLGTQAGNLYVHSSIADWKHCLHSVRLSDAVLNIVHLQGRVFVALADGTVAVFHRRSDGQWDLRSYHVIDLGQPRQSVRCMCAVAGASVWCGWRNQIHVICPKTLKVQKSFDAHPRRESQVRLLSWAGDGVWVSIRLDSTLRLYHTHTHQHLQDVDIEPYVGKMLGSGKLGFSFVRITALAASCRRLWIGTSNGVIISIPMSDSVKSEGASADGSGQAVRVYANPPSDSLTPGSYMPYCSLSQAQFSFHGHKDAAKFFVSVPGAVAKPSPKRGSATPPPCALVLSGGEGYIDFRVGEPEDGENDENTARAISSGDQSHLIVWQVSRP